MTLESALEQSFAQVIRDNEATLAAIRINCSALGLDQVPVADDEEEPLEQKPLPCITLTATRQGEDPPASGVFEVTLQIDAEAKSVKPEGDGMSLDDIFEGATRPLKYPALFGKLNSTTKGCFCYGMPRRMDGMSQSAHQSSWVRSATATFVVALT